MSLVSAGSGVAIAPHSAKNIQIPGATHRAIAGQPILSEIVIAWHKDNDLPLLHRFTDLVCNLDLDFALQGT